MENPKSDLVSIIGLILGIASLSLTAWYVFSQVHFAVLMAALLLAGSSLVLCTLETKAYRRAGRAERIPSMGITLAVVSICLAFLSVLYFLLIVGRFD